MARRAIFDIHTKNWNPPLSVEFKNKIADATVGFCGADMKALCAEAALRAVRRRYPQIYESDHKLLLNPKSIFVTLSDFADALHAITPASHRAAIVHARPLPSAITTSPRCRAALYASVSCVA